MQIWFPRYYGKLFHCIRFSICSTEGVLVLVCTEVYMCTVR